MTTAKIDDNILHLFQHRPQVILGDITVTKKMDRIPDVCQTKRQKCTFSMRVFTCRIQRCGNSSVQINVCVKFVARQHALPPPANCAPLAVAPLQIPCVVQWKTSRSLLQQILDAESHVRPLPPLEFQSGVLLGLVREHLTYKPRPACKL